MLLLLSLGNVLQIVAFAGAMSYQPSVFFRAPSVTDKTVTEVKFEINDEMITTPLQVSTIERPDTLIVLNVTGEEMYGGASYINFDKGVIVSHGKDMEPCTVFHIPEHISPRSIWHDMRTKANSIKEGQNFEPLLSASCRYAGRISNAGWLGRDIQGFCAPFLFEMYLTVDCRFMSKEEAEVHDDKCDVGFVYSENGIQIACVRLWQPLEDRCAK